MFTIMRYCYVNKLVNENTVMWIDVDVVIMKAGSR